MEIDYSPDEYRYYERYRYSQEKNIFYKAETWETDDWTGYIAELDRLLKIGAFTKARQLVSEKGVTPNGGHTSYQDEVIFSKFVDAIYREAKRAKKLGHKKVAGKLVFSLFSMPFWHEGSPDTDDFYIFPREEKEENPRSNILAVTSKNTALINDFSIFLSGSGYNKKSILLLNQITKYSPKSTFAWKSLGDVYLLLNKQEAIKAYSVYFDLMKEKGLEGVISEKVLHLINKKQAIGLDTPVDNEQNSQAENITKIIWYDGYINEYPIKAKVVFNNRVIQQLSYAYSKTKKWINLSNLKYNKGIFHAIENEKEKTTGFWKLNLQKGGNLKGNWESPIGKILPILLEPKSKLAKSVNISAPNNEVSKPILIDINYDGYLDLIKGNPTLRKGSTTKKYYSHSVYLFDKKIKEYKFIKDLSYFSHDVYMNIENYNLFNKSFRACNRSRKNPKRARKCWNFYTATNKK